jgi:hypothetical protein
MAGIRSLVDTLAENAFLHTPTISRIVDCLDDLVTSAAYALEDARRLRSEILGPGVRFGVVALARSLLIMSTGGRASRRDEFDGAEIAIGGKSR